MTPHLSVRDLNYRFGNRVLFEKISFDVMPGEFAAIIGPNGAGKTTLLRCVLRILNDWRGTVALDGVSVRDTSRKRLAKRIAYVQQNLTTVFSFTVRQIVEMGRYPHLHPLSPLTQEDRRIVDESLDAMEIASFANRKIDTLSGGERQKVILAAALAQQPDLMLLDEPTTFLDYRHQDEICRYLRQINRERKTTILEVTHDVNRAALEADHIIAISDARIVFDGPPGDLMNEKRLGTIYHAGFELVPHPGCDRKMIVPRGTVSSGP